MNRRYAGLVVGVSLVLSAAGCGTYNNVLGDSQHMVYGGVRRDGVILRECSGGSPNRAKGFDDPGVLPMVDNAAAMTAFMDLPFSFVGDTLTLPFTLCCALVQGGEAEPESTARAAAVDPRR